MNPIRRQFLIALACTLSLACSVELAMAQPIGSPLRVDPDKLFRSFQACENSRDGQARSDCKDKILAGLNRVMPEDHRFDQARTACIFSSSPDLTTRNRHDDVYDRCLDIAITYFMEYPRPISTPQEKAYFLTLVCSSMDEKAEKTDSNPDFTQMKRACLNSTFVSNSMHVMTDGFESKVTETGLKCARDVLIQYRAHSIPLQSINNNLVACQQTQLLSLAGALQSLKPDPILQAVNQSREAKATQEARAQAERKQILQSPFASAAR